MGWGGVGGEGLSRQWAGQDLVMVRGPGARRRQSLSVRWGGERSEWRCGGGGRGQG